MSRSPLAPDSAQLRELLHTTRVLTTVQLGRLGLQAAATRLQLPEVTRTCRTRVTQQDSTVDLTFVALTPAVLNRAYRDLMHDAGVAEAYLRLQPPHPSRWRLLQSGGLGREHRPDAEYLTDPADHRHDHAIEFDAGYAPRKIEEKLRAMVQQGYTRLTWATSVHGRVDRVMSVIVRLQARGELPGLLLAQTLFVEFWARSSPYSGRPRCRKSDRLVRQFGQPV
jgi:hypothetical protein